MQILNSKVEIHITKDDACHVKQRWMSPTATAATPTGAGSPTPRPKPSPPPQPAQCQKCHETQLPNFVSAIATIFIRENSIRCAAAMELTIPDLGLPRQYNNKTIILK
jgi:hypothetical protein